MARAKGIPCTIGSHWRIGGQSPQPKYDEATHKWRCPWCGRLCEPNRNLGSVWVLPRHNKPPKPAE